MELAAPKNAQKNNVRRSGALRTLAQPPEIPTVYVFKSSILQKIWAFCIGLSNESLMEICYTFK